MIIFNYPGLEVGSEINHDGYCEIRENSIEDVINRAKELYAKCMVDKLESTLKDIEIDNSFKYLYSIKTGAYTKHKYAYRTTDGLYVICDTSELSRHSAKLYLEKYVYGDVEVLNTSSEWTIRKIRDGAIIMTISKNCKKYNINDNELQTSDIDSINKFLYTVIPAFKFHFERQKTVNTN